MYSVIRFVDVATREDQFRRVRRDAPFAMRYPQAESINTEIVTRSVPLLIGTPSAVLPRIRITWTLSCKQNHG